MGFVFHRTFEKDAIADGTTWADSWVADLDYVIKRIHIRRKDGYALHKSTFYWKVADKVYTRPIVPAGVLGEDVLVTPVIDVPITKGEKLDFTFKNLEGTAIDVYLVFEVHSA